MPIYPQSTHLSQKPTPVTYQLYQTVAYSILTSFTDVSLVITSGPKLLCMPLHNDKNKQPSCELASSIRNPSIHLHLRALDTAAYRRWIWPYILPYLTLSIMTERACGLVGSLVRVRRKEGRKEIRRGCQLVGFCGIVAVAAVGRDSIQKGVG